MEYLFDVTPDNFDEIVIKGSASNYIVVDFWAPWCNPCKQLKPLLESLAPEYGFILAKINTEEHQQLATQMGVRGIPDVRIYKDGDVIDQFTGAVPESELRAKLEKYFSSSTDDELEQIIEQAKSGQISEAIERLNALLTQQPDNDKLKITAANILMESGNNDAGKTILSSIKMSSEYFTMAQSQLALESFYDVCDEEGNPEGLALNYKNAACAAKVGDYDDALRNLMEIIKKDKEFDEGAAKDAMVILFELLGRDDPITKKYQRLLAMYLY